jgi:ATP-dependent helicase HrpA
VLEDPTQPHPRKQDAIHRAVLSGLLGNVGLRTGRDEYSGVRGKKFHLFPGSALYRRKPEWVMAAELVETTRLYARTVASVHPLWVERAAAHLVKRTLADPHWRPDLGRVMAFERVTLHGLTLIPNRRVHFGPLEPKLSREIFIRHALVLGEYETGAPYFLHNMRLVNEVQSIEAKSRRRDVLVDPEARFKFFDARVPRRIYTADEFEKWRTIAEKHNPRLLFMARGDIMLHPALGVTAELYPDSISADGLNIPLEYRFEPGDRADGITATVPLAALNQLSAEAFDWLAPGFRFDLFVALMRTLPKSLRVKFVPVPDFAAGAARDLKPSDGPVRRALAEYLGRRSGEIVRPDDFQSQNLPDFLRMNFRVVDLAGKEVAIGRDLERIRHRLGMQARATFAASPPAGFHRDGFTRWEFDDLPPVVEFPHRDITLAGYPAIVDAGATVSIRLFDLPDAAAEAHRAGLRRLFMIQVRQELEYLERTFPDLERLCLYYATLGRGDELKDDLLLATADRAFFNDPAAADIRTRDAFAGRAEIAWRRLPGVAPAVYDVASKILDAYHGLDLALDGEFPPLWNDSIRDMRDQLSHLVYRGFVASTPFESLVHLPRYLAALELRLKKLANAGLTRDTQATAEIAPLWEQYKRQAIRLREQGVRDPALEEYRWGLEEFRVALFAQELKPAHPVSAERLGRIWERVKK